MFLFIFYTDNNTPGDWQEAIRCYAHEYHRKGLSLKTQLRQLLYLRCSEFFPAGEVNGDKLMSYWNTYRKGVAFANFVECVKKEKK